MVDGGVLLRILISSQKILIGLVEAVFSAHFVPIDAGPAHRQA